MGTNYYMVRGDHYPETEYGHPFNNLLKSGTGYPPMIHIGKSSGGWCFSLHIYPYFGVHTLTDWRNLAARLLREGWRIEDECRTEHSPDDLWRVVERVGWSRNDGEPLRRHTVDHIYCVGNGEGLYDYMIGEFS